MALGPSLILPPSPSQLEKNSKRLWIFGCNMTLKQGLGYCRVDDCEADFVQNLIPLCLRPFRLILPSETARSARIAILKATHLPFVGAIWAYEQLVNSRKQKTGLMSFNGPQGLGSTKRPPRLAINSPGFLIADPEATLIPPFKSHQAGRPHSKAGLAEQDAELKTLVLELTAQVKELTAVVSQLQQQNETSEAA